jgi:hypothetical protein
VTKGPGCECCDGWAKHLRANGYSVSVTESDELDSVKEKLGIPADLRTCHTGQLGSYLLEGHVPAAAIAYLLREKPEGLTGLAVPGMPVGASGMEVKALSRRSMPSSSSERRAAKSGRNSRGSIGSLDRQSDRSGQIESLGQSITPALESRLARF